MGYGERVITYRNCRKCRQDIYANAVEFQLHIRACKAGLILPQITRAITIRKVEDEEDWTE